MVVMGRGHFSLSPYVMNFKRVRLWNQLNRKQKLAEMVTRRPTTKKKFAPGIIHGDRCDRKTPKTIVLLK